MNVAMEESQFLSNRSCKTSFSPTSVVMKGRQFLTDFQDCYGETMNVEDRSFYVHMVAIN